MHSHRTAEVFFVLKGRWRFFWGGRGAAGEVTLQEGDIFNIPTGIFRGFENTGSDFGMIMAIPGGNDSGGGVIWAPQVIEYAKDHGLVLGENGKLYDTKKGEKLPDGIKPMPLLSDEEPKNYPKLTTADVVPHFVARYWDVMALAGRELAKVIGEDAMLRDRPGFEVDFVTRGSAEAAKSLPERKEVLMPVRGHWRIGWNGSSDVLNPGATCLVPTDTDYSLKLSVASEASLYRIRNTDDSAGATLER